MKLKCEAHSIGSFEHSLQHVLVTFCQTTGSKLVFNAHKISLQQMSNRPESL